MCCYPDLVGFARWLKLQPLSSWWSSVLTLAALGSASLFRCLKEPKPSVAQCSLSYLLLLAYCWGQQNSVCMWINHNYHNGTPRSHMLDNIFHLHIPLLSHFSSDYQKIQLVGFREFMFMHTFLGGGWICKLNFIPSTLFFLKIHKRVSSFLLPHIKFPFHYSSLLILSYSNKNPCTVVTGRRAANSR